MTIGILNPGSGNITSVCDALDRLKRPFTVLSEPHLSGIRQILIPGQGRFGAVMGYLRRTGWDRALRSWTDQNKPLIGICVGMQILFEGSEEDPEEPGVGIFGGKVTKLAFPKHPMIGWSPVRWQNGAFTDGAAYFVNSYGVADHQHGIATTTYGQPFCVAVAKGRCLAFQFHPEKSGLWGKELLDRCLIC